MHVVCVMLRIKLELSECWTSVPPEPSCQALVILFKLITHLSVSCAPGFTVYLGRMACTLAEEEMIILESPRIIKWRQILFFFPYF